MGDDPIVLWISCFLQRDHRNLVPCDQSRDKQLESRGITITFKTSVQPLWTFDLQTIEVDFMFSVLFFFFSISFFFRLFSFPFFFFFTFIFLYFFFEFISYCIDKILIIFFARGWGVVIVI